MSDVLDGIVIMALDARPARRAMATDATRKQINDILRAAGVPGASVTSSGSPTHSRQANLTSNMPMMEVHRGITQAGFQLHRKGSKVPGHYVDSVSHVYHHPEGHGASVTYMTPTEAGTREFNFRPETRHSFLFKTNPRGAAPGEPFRRARTTETYNPPQTRSLGSAVLSQALPANPIDATERSLWDPGNSNRAPAGHQGGTGGFELRGLLPQQRSAQTRASQPKPSVGRAKTTPTFKPRAPKSMKPSNENEEE